MAAAERIIASLKLGPLGAVAAAEYSKSLTSVATSATTPTIRQLTVGTSGVGLYVQPNFMYCYVDDQVNPQTIQINTTFNLSGASTYTLTAEFTATTPYFSSLSANSQVFVNSTTTFTAIGISTTNIVVIYW
jgi:hypothetical protein